MATKKKANTKKAFNSSAYYGFIVFAVVAALFMVGYLFWDNKVNSPDKEEDPSTRTAQEEQTDLGYKVYTNSDYGFSFEYPAFWGELEAIEESSSFSDKKAFRIMPKETDLQKSEIFFAEEGWVGGEFSTYKDESFLNPVCTPDKMGDEDKTIVVYRDSSSCLAVGSGSFDDSYTAYPFAQKVISTSKGKIGFYVYSSSTSIADNSDAAVKERITANVDKTVYTLDDLYQDDLTVKFLKTIKTN